METRNHKRKIRKSRRTLDQIRKHSRQSSNSEDSPIKKCMKGKSSRKTHKIKIPNITSDRLTLGMRTYGNIVVSETITRKSLIQKRPVSNTEPANHCATEINHSIHNNKENNVLSKARSDTSRSSESVRGIPEEDNVEYRFELCQNLVENLQPEYLRRLAPSLTHGRVDAKIKASVSEMVAAGFYSIEETDSENESALRSGECSLDPREYISRSCKAAGNPSTSSQNLCSATSVGNGASPICRTSSSPSNAVTPFGRTSLSQILDGSSFSKTSLTNFDANLVQPDYQTDADTGTHSSASEKLKLCMSSPILTPFVVFGDTPHCEYFPRKLNK